MLCSTINARHSHANKQTHKCITNMCSWTLELRVVRDRNVAKWYSILRKWHITFRRVSAWTLPWAMLFLNFFFFLFIELWYVPEAVILTMNHWWMAHILQSLVVTHCVTFPTRAALSFHQMKTDVWHCEHPFQKTPHPLVIKEFCCRASECCMLHLLETIFIHYFSFFLLAKCQFFLCGKHWPWGDSGGRPMWSSFSSLISFHQPKASAAP